MSDQEPTPNTALEESLEGAYAGRRDAIENFFKAILKGPLYIPRRYQAHPMSDSPTYPNDFVDVLGIIDDDRTIVPLFSTPEGIENWCGNALLWRCLNGVEAAQAIPDDWWIVINPGSEIEKELTPWEILRLRDGLESVPELVAEALTDREVDPMRVRPLESGDFDEAREHLLAHVRDDIRVKTLYMLIEESTSADGTLVSTLLVGIAVTNDVPGAEFSRVQDEFEVLIAPFMIGGQPKKIFIGYDVNKSVMLGIFKGSEPVFTRNAGQQKPTLMTRLRSLLGMS